MIRSQPDGFGSGLGSGANANKAPSGTAGETDGSTDGSSDGSSLWRCAVLHPILSSFAPLGVVFCTPSSCSFCTPSTGAGFAPLWMDLLSPVTFRIERFRVLISKISGSTDHDSMSGTFNW